MDHPAEPPPRVHSGELLWGEVADAVWLASVVGAPRGPSARQSPDPVRDDPLPDRAGATPPAEPPADRTAAVPPFLPRPVLASRVDGQSVGGPQLPDTRALVRALRPLAISGPSTGNLVLDEEAVAIRAAETRRWLPVLRPAFGPLLDAVLMVDDSPSMKLWRNTVLEFRQLLEQLGAFRDVRVAWVDADDERPSTYTTSTWSAPHTFEELTDPTGRRVVFVLTDGVGRAWRDAAVGRWLPRLAWTGPLVVLNVLPYRLWRLGKLSTVRARLSAAEPVTANRRLRYRLLWPDVAEPRHTGLVVPVLELSGRWLARWARLMAATGEAGVELPAAIIDRDAEPAETAAFEPADEVAATDRVRRFHAQASSTAFRLATTLAAVPLTSTVLRVVQRTIVPGATTAHVAEVLLSGMVAPVRSDTAVEYEFSPGVREELLAGARRNETVRVVNLAAEHLGGRLPELLHLRDALTHPHTAPIPHEFAAMAIQHTVLRALSGPYLARAKRLSDKLMSHPRSDMSEAAQEYAGRETRSWVRDDQLPPRNLHFANRDELSVVRSYLAAGRRVVLHGKPGTGKTELAREYAHRFADEHELVWWFPAREPAAIVARYRELAIRLNLTGEGAGGQAAVAAVRAALADEDRYGQWLLIFDDAGDPDVLAQYLPETQVLVTSRDHTWSQFATAMEVGPFRPAESLHLLARNGLDPVAARELADALGHLPAAVDHVRHRIARGDGLSRKYRQQVAAGNGYGAAFAEVRGGAAFTVLGFCAVLGREPLPDKVFDHLSPPEPDTSWQPARQALAASGLALHRQAALVVPEPVRAQTMALLGDDEVNRLRRAAQVALHELIGANPRRWATLLPHVRASGAMSSDDPTVRRIAVELITYLLDTGDPDNALDLIDSSGRAWSAALGNGHAETLEMAALLGVAHRIGGDRRKAARIHRRLHHTAGIALARSLREVGELDAAVDCASTLHESTEHANELTALAAAAESAASQRLVAVLNSVAIPLSVQELQSEIQHRLHDRLGQNHPATLAAVADHALTLRLLDAADDARRLNEATLPALRDTVGPDHLLTLACATNLASDRYATNNLDEALAMDRDIATHCKTAHGTDHPATLAVRLNEATALRAAGQTTIAERIRTEVRSTCHRTLGEKHPLTRLAATSTRVWFEADPPALWTAATLDSTR